MATYLDDIRQGDDVKIAIQYPDTVDLTGYKFWLTLKSSFSDSDANAVLVAETTAGDHPDDDETAGLVYLTIDGTASAAATPGKYYYDLQVMDADGNISTLLPPADDYKDKILLAPQVTKAAA